MLLGMPNNGRAMCFELTSGKLIAADADAWQVYKQLHKLFGDAVAYVSDKALNEEQWEILCSSDAARCVFAEKICGKLKAA